MEVTPLSKCADHVIAWNSTIHNAEANSGYRIRGLDRPSTPFVAVDQLGKNIEAVELG